MLSRKMMLFTRISIFILTLMILYSGYVWGYVHDDMLKILEDEKVNEIGGVMHSFSGDLPYLNKIINMNLHISFTGNITFKKSTSDDLVKKVPIENLLLETDSPFLTPVPLRGKRNEPAFVIHTAKKIAKIKEIDIEILAKVTTENAKSLFRLDI